MRPSWPRTWRRPWCHNTHRHARTPTASGRSSAAPVRAILSWAWFVVAVIILVDLAVQGRDHDALVTAVLVLVITGVVYSCAWRPKIVADTGGITVINPVRDHQVPWAAVTTVDVVNAVRVHCAPVAGAERGKVLYSWAVQSSPRSARKAALRREVSSQPRARLTPRPRSLHRRPAGRPAGTARFPSLPGTRWSGLPPSSPPGAWPSARSMPSRQPGRGQPRPSARARAGGWRPASPTVRPQPASRPDPLADGPSRWPTRPGGVSGAAGGPAERPPSAPCIAAASRGAWPGCHRGHDGAAARAPRVLASESRGRACRTAGPAGP